MISRALPSGKPSAGDYKRTCVAFRASLVNILANVFVDGAIHLKLRCKVLYINLLTSGKLNSYLADIDEQVEDMFLRLAK